MTYDLVLRDARVMTCVGPGLGIVERAAVAIDGGAIAWVGEGAPDGREVVDCGGQLVTPGLVDCHTHAIFAGDRSSEFAMRAAGASYLDIAAAGGGIAATLGPTRAASDAELTALLDARLALARATGTTTMEVKTGYDLTAAGELRLLRLLQRPGVVPTLLAHLIPPGARRPTAIHSSARSPSGGSRAPSGSRAASTSTATRARTRSPRRA